MAKHDAGTELKRDEFSKIFDEYRAKIEEITRRSETNFQINEIKSDNVHTDEVHPDEEEHIEVVSASPSTAADTAANPQSQPESTLLPMENPVPVQAESIENKIESPAESTPSPRIEPAPKLKIEDDRSNGNHPVFHESADILNQAKREAKQIIEEAEESAKKEAKKRTQSQVDKIIDKARKEADDIIARANKNAEKVRDDVITESKREADLIIREITDKYRQETEAKSSRIMAEAQEKAGKILADVSATTSQISNHITEIVHRARQTTNELENTLQTEINELNKIIGETKQKLEEEKIPTNEERYNPPDSKQIGEMITGPSLEIRLIGEKAAGTNGSGAMFSGQMEMKSASESFDYQYLKKLKKYLVHIPRIKYLQEYASEKEMSVVFDVLEPLPLFDILSKVPIVEKIITRADDNFCLVFKTNVE